MTIPGQPISTNHAYKRGTIRLGDGTTVGGMVKTDAATAYQDGVRLIARAARPSDWVPLDGQFVRIRFRYFLNPDIDADNLKKLVIDAIFNKAKGAIAFNDRWVLTCDVSKQKVAQGKQRIELEIGMDTEIGAHA